MNKYLKYGLIGIIILTLGVGIGRFSKPAEVKVVTKTDIKEVIKIVEVKQENKNIVVKTKKTTNKDGTIVEESIVEDKTSIKTDTNIDSSKQISFQQSTITKRDRGLTVQALAITTDISDINNNIQYGGLLKFRVIGNSSMTILGATNGKDKTIGVAAGWDF